jgi:hypothetical protein
MQAALICSLPSSVLTLSLSEVWYGIGKQACCGWIFSWTADANLDASGLLLQVVIAEGHVDTAQFLGRLSWAVSQLWHAAMLHHQHN